MTDVERLREELAATRQALYEAEARLVGYLATGGPLWLVVPPTETATSTWRIYRQGKLYTELDGGQDLDEVLRLVDEQGGPLGWRRDGDGVWRGRRASAGPEDGDEATGRLL